MIGQHALDMKRLQGDGAVGIDQSPADLMVKIPPLIGDSFMLDRYPMPVWWLLNSSISTFKSKIRRCPL
jgi:hypothetical protein